MFDLTQVSRRGPVAITTVLSICVAVQAVWFFTTMRTWLDEGNYLYKSSALIGHGMELYSLELPCWYTPFYLVALGVWQEALGYGLFSGRTFSVLCFVGSLLLTVFLVRRLYSGRWAVPVLLGFVAVTPSIAVAHSCVTQIAFVSLLVALLFWVMFGMASDRARWLVSGLLMGLISMTRPNMLLMLPMVPVLFFWLRGWKGWRPCLEMALVWVVVIGAFTAVFGSGALWNLIRMFPGSDQVADWIGLTGNAAVGTLDGTDLGLRIGDWWTNRPENQVGSHVYFFQGYLWPYLLIVAVNLGGLVMWLREGRRPTVEAGFALLFFWSSLLHFVGTQTFCKSCAQAYMNYSILPGLIGAVGNLFPVARWIRQPRPMLRGAVPVVATLTILWVGLAWLPEGPYRKWYHPNPGKSIVDLARELGKRLPDEAHVLALGHDIRLVEGIHLSGRTVDPLTINYLFSLRDLVDPKAGIDLQKIEDIRQRGLWTHDLMRFWLARDYDYVVYLDKIVPHKDVLDRWYTSEPLFPGDSENVFLSSLRLAVRKEVAMNEEANQEE